MQNRHDITRVEPEGFVQVFAPMPVGLRSLIYGVCLAYMILLIQYMGYRFST